MNNFLNNLKFLKLKKKLAPFLKKTKRFFKNKTLKIIFVSFLTVVVTVGILFSILWFNKEKLFNFIASNYIFQPNLAREKPILIEKIEEIPAVVAVKEEKKEEIVKEEETVVSAVKKAKPAVVSVVVNKEVPRYEIKYEEEKITNSDGDRVIVKNPIKVPNGTEYKQVGTGSGFLISTGGMIVTNRHVVESTEGVKFTVLLNNGNEYEAKVLARDPVLDVAILKIEATNLPFLKLSNSDELQVGESVVAIGNAMGEFRNTVSVGVVSGLSRSLMASGSGGYKEFLYKVIQTDAAINPGNSGGPLLNLAGDVIGINVALAEGSSNIGFSLPIDSVKGVIEQVSKTGKITRPYVGVRYVVVDQSLKIKLELPVGYGVLVKKGSKDEEAVISGSPAAKAGILENDIILSVDGEIINAGNDFMSLIRSKKIGDQVILKVLSNNVEKNISIKLEELPEAL